MSCLARPPSEFWHFTRLVDDKRYRLHHKGPMAPKFTRPQPTWLLCVGCNALGLSQTLLKTRDHSRAKKCTVADLGRLAADNGQRSYQRLSQTSEWMRFGRWWTFWANDVNFVQEYFNWTVYCFINVEKSVLTCCLSSVSKTRDRYVVKCKIFHWVIALNAA